MHMIEAVIKPQRLDNVKIALAKIDSALNAVSSRVSPRNDERLQ